MRKKLVRTLGIATLVAAVLGGAAALGGTLFESPPRDLAEFKKRVDAGSVHIDPNRARPEKPRRAEKAGTVKTAARPTEAERRYARTLNAWCVQQEDDVEALGTLYDVGDYLSLSRSWRARVASLEAPHKLRDAKARYLRTWERLDGIVVKLAGANARGDSVAALELYDRWVQTAAAQSDAALALGADRCAGWLLQGVTPS